MNLFKSRTLRFTIWAMVLLLVGLVAAISLLSYLIFSKQVRDERVHTNLALLKEINRKFELVIGSVDRNLIDLLQNDTVRKFLEYEDSGQEIELKTQTLIDRTLNANDSILSIELYSYVRSKLIPGVAMTDALPPNSQWVNEFKNYTGYSLWLPTHKMEISISSFPIFRNVVTFIRTYPLIHPVGYRKGAIAVHLKEEELYKLLQNLDDRGNNADETFLLDAQGRVILHQDIAMLSRSIAELPSIAPIFQGAKEGHYSTRIEGKENSVYYITAETTGWKFVRIVPSLQQNKPLVYIRNLLAIVAGVLSLIAIISVVFVGHWTLRPVHRFLQNMSREAKLTGVRKLNIAGGARNEFVDLETMIGDVLKESEEMHVHMKESRHAMKWRLLMDLLTHYRTNYAEIQSYLGYMGISLEAACYRVMILEFDDRSTIESVRDLQLYGYALANVAEELTRSECRGVAIELGDGTCAVILCMDEVNNENETALRAVALAELIKHMVKKYFKRTVSVGIGSEAESLHKLHQSFQHAGELLKYKLVMGPDAVITKEDIGEQQTGESHQLFGMSDAILDSLKRGDTERMHGQIDNWFEAMKASKVPPDWMKQMNVQFAMKATFVAEEIHPDLAAYAQEFRWYERLSAAENLEEIKKLLNRIMDGWIGMIKEKRSHGGDRTDLIEKVIAFIDEHYGRSDLSLNVLADQFAVSLFHLSRTFKEQTARNFIDYVVDIRMLKAKELLLTTEDKIKDIADTVGYANVNSFIRIFKRVTGLTPKEYRDRKQE
jgi:two-component system response regulator YesN